MAEPNTKPPNDGTVPTWADLAGGERWAESAEMEAKLLWARRALAHLDAEILGYVRRYGVPTPDALEQRVEAGVLGDGEDARYARDAVPMWRAFEGRRHRLLLLTARLMDRVIGAQPRVVRPSNWHELVAEHVRVPADGHGGAPVVGRNRVPLADVVSAAFDIARQHGASALAERLPGLSIEEMAAAEVFAQSALESGGALARGLAAMASEQEAPEAGQ